MSSCWAPQGIRPSIPSHYMREYRYCYGAVDAQTGDSFFLIAGGCNTEWTNEFLRQVSQAYPDDYMLLVMDNAIWHKSSTLEIPSNIELAFIPPYTPEMNPIEQVWKEMHKLLPFSPDSVVTHGDFSLDNLIFDEGKLIGCIDVGRVGIADRYQDLAILWNCLGEFSPSLQKRLFQKYGIDNPDMNKLQFHLMLDEFF